MKLLILIFLLFTLGSCSSYSGSGKTVYWCGDHACINKKEKKSYFKETMIVEKRNIKKEKKLTKSEIDIIKKKIKKEEKKKT